MTKRDSFKVAIIGAGPAGLFAAQALAEKGIGSVIFNRDIKPGGLAEYGIYPDKLRIKNGLRAQFRQILAIDQVSYFGNVSVGNSGCFGIQDLLDWGFSAVLVASGAQGTKSLNLPGENLEGVYHAKDLVYHYNRLPPHSTREFAMGKRVAIVGAGNVMTDIARYLINYRDVEDITVVVRRGPAEVKFDKKEMNHLISYLDEVDFSTEMERVSDRMKAIGQIPDEARNIILAARDQADPKEKNSTLRLRFLYSPKEIIGNEQNQACGLKLEENTLEVKDGSVVSKGLGKLIEIQVDNVIFAIGDKVTNDLNLPLEGNEIYKSAKPNFAVEGISYEVGNPETSEPIKGVFCAGWSRKASTGLVGLAHKDGLNAARAIEAFIGNQENKGITFTEVEKHLRSMGCKYVTSKLLEKLNETEKIRAEDLHVDDFKFSTNEEMFEAMGIVI